jgi:SAM-dependent methyltransferase
VKRAPDIAAAVRDGAAAGAPARCLCCGSAEIASVDVLSADLIAAWELAPEEIAYVNRQQGLHCRDCGATLRCWGLAAALMRLHGFAGLFADFVQTPAASELRVLEINEAGALTRYLRALPRHTLGRYPAIDMSALPFADRSFDLVVHADTIEHVPDPIAGLSECHRVLDIHGVCAFTAPLIVGRLTRSRQGLPPCFHGTAAEAHPYVVHTEYGADLWTHALRAGFPECRAYSLEYPATVAWLACK